jgi:hypothetical protein
VTKVPGHLLSKLAILDHMVATRSLEVTAPDTHDQFRAYDATQPRVIPGASSVSPWYGCIMGALVAVVLAAGLLLVVVVDDEVESRERITTVDKTP